MAGLDDAVRQACDMHARGLRAQAVAACRRVVQRDPGHFEANRQLAIMLCLERQAEQAVFFARKALAGAAGPAARAAAQSTLGSVLLRIGRDAEAVPPLEEAVRLDPGQATAWGDLALIYMGQRRFDPALDAAGRAVSLNPAAAPPRINLATLRLEIGDAAGAMEVLGDLRRDAPTDPLVAQALASASLYADGLAPQEVFELHAAAGRMFGGSPPDRSPMKVAPSPEPGRPLRVGLVSPDVYDHSVAYFLEPMLAGRVRADWSAVVVRTGGPSDPVTARLRGLADEWIDAGSMPDDALGAQLRSARLDIAVDLAGLTSGGRPGLFARRVAPVQLTAIGYPHTTGLAAMDYRLVDATTDPDGAERFATEKLARLPGCFLCYRPPDDSPPVSARRAEPPVTFGSFNSIKKLTPGTIGLWSRVLRAVPGSRIVLKGGGFSSRAARELAYSRFAAGGVAEDRVELRAYTPGKSGHLAAYHDVDIALDTFPYHGTTTTCEALWMGVPVVSRVGDSHASRVGATLLGAVGLPGHVAHDDGAFVRIAADLADDAAARRGLRAELRGRVAASTLCDAAGYGAKIATMLRELWHERGPRA